MQEVPRQARGERVVRRVGHGVVTVLLGLSIAVIALSVFAFVSAEHQVSAFVGGAAGALLVWWLDDRRVSRRERQELIGALELVGLELGANIAQADLWVRPQSSQALAPIELRWEAWSAHQATIARSLPRDVVGQIGVGYELARALQQNADASRRRGVVEATSRKLALRTRDCQQENLKATQDYMRRRLAVRFTHAPIPTSAIPTTPDERPSE